MTELDRLEQVGALRLLVALHEKQRYVTEIVRRSTNLQGLMSQDALRKCRHNLLDLNLIEEVTEEGPRPRTFLVITDKGRRVAQKIKEIQEILEKD